jgi:uncharacterized repeat protein (TIGR01451 family)
MNLFLSARRSLAAVVLLVSFSLFTTTQLFSSGRQAHPIHSFTTTIQPVYQLDGFQFTLSTPRLTLAKDGRLLSPSLTSQTSQPGAPLLPTYTTLVALPPGAEVTIQVEEAQATNQSAAYLRPVPQLLNPARIGDEGTAALTNPAATGEIEQPDPAIYEQNALYPAASYTLSPPMYLRDLRLAQLTLYPLRYNPVSGELHHAAELHVTLTFSGQTGRLNPAWAVGGDFAAAYDRHIINNAQAAVWRSLPAEQEALTTELPLGVDVYKIEVAQDGIYELTYSALAAAGMNVASVNPHTFQMLYRGEPVAYQFIGDGDTIFEANEKLRFYGWAFNGSRLEKQFVANNVYWLWAGGSASLITTTTNPNGYPADATFLSSVTYEPELWWFSSWTDEWDTFPNEPDAWYWQRLIKLASQSAVTSTVAVTLPFPATTGPNATWTAEFSSYPTSSDPHVVTVDMNDYPSPGVGNWFGIQNVNISGNIPLANVLNGPNEFDIVLSTVGVDRVYLNRITVDYQRRYLSQNNQLLFSEEAGGQRRFDVQGYGEGNAANVLVWNISDPLMPVQVPMSAANISGSNPYTYTFGSDHAAGASFIATTTGNVLSPLAISQYIGQDLDPAAGADWVAIAYEEFIAESNRLALHRADELFGGLSTHVVDVADVINQYGYGLPLPAAIQAYLQHALLNWPVAPTYATLVGDATTNPKQIVSSSLPTGDPQLVPADLLFVDRYQGQVPTDLPYALLVGDDLLADIAIGRLPAQNLAEITAMVDKIILYEQNHLTPEEWMKNWLYVADDPDDAGDFCQESVLSSHHVPAMFEQTFLCLPSGASVADVQALRTQMFDALNNSGVTLLNYRGHGAIQFWAGAPASIMAVTDVPNWNNPDRPVVILTSDCLDGYFTYPGFQGLSETFLKAAGKGSAAHWSSTGLGLTYEHSVLTDGFYDALFIDGETAIGRTVNLAKTAYLQSGQHTSLLYTFTLLADPAMSLMRPELSLTKTALQSTAEPGDTVEFVLEIANNGLYPAPVTVTDLLPHELNYVSAVASVTNTVTTVGDAVYIDLLFGSEPTDHGMPWGATAVITLTTQVDALAGDGPVTNLATINGPWLDIAPGDESDTAEVDINSLITNTPSPTPSPTPTSTPNAPGERLLLPFVIDQ